MPICSKHASAFGLAFAIVVSSAVAVGPAFAQGRSDAAPGQNKNKPSNPSAKTRSSSSGLASPATATSSTSAPVASANAVMYYGSWLDDASIVEPGDIWIGLATGYWRGDNNRQFDAPVASAAVGISRRFQAGGNLSFYHFRDADGVSENGLGNLSVYGKFQLLDAYRAPNAIGLAVTPLVELSPGSEDEFGWALPVNVEGHRGDLRIYASGGYFSRGSIFASVGADIPVGSRASISGNFGQSYARAGTHQTSIGAGVALSLTGTNSVYVGLGRTFMPTEVGPGGVSLAGGMSFLLPEPRARP
jgi:hypothetical protein